MPVVYLFTGLTKKTSAKRTVMKTCLFLLSLLLGIAAAEAQYNNEWIDFSKTYYKCKVGQTGLCRIGTDALAGLGLGNVPAEQFQMWRNGKQVVLYTSAASGDLPAGGYIEWYGEINDGLADDKLYKNPAYHLNKTYSLSTDTSAYFLTVNPNGANLRYSNEANDVQSNTQPPESYFSYTYQSDFKETINRGKGLYYGQTIYSSTYDLGEFWSSYNIPDNTTRADTMSNLNVATTGPAATLSVSAAGNSSGGNDRRLNVSLNNVSYISQPLPDYNSGLFTAGNIPLSALASNTATIVIANQNSDNNAFDYLVAGTVHLTYPHSFNFGGAKRFAFTVAASGTGNYLEITNFNSGSVTPVLYDLSNGKRYVANTATPGILKFKIYGSSVDQAISLVLVNEEASNSTAITSFTRRTFVDYSLAGNQGDYLILSNPILMAGDNPVEQYRQYRSSATGGGYNAKIYDADELVDQFAFGIKKHPLGIKNFLQYTRNVFSSKPKFIFIIGRGVTYDSYRYNESSRYADQLNLVPTFGWPASDAILASNTFDPVAATPIGRLSVIRGSEIKDYLQKIKEYEQQANTTQTIDNKAWMKTVVNVTGANNSAEDVELTGYLNKYGNLLKDTLFGGDLHSFNKATTGEATPITDAALTQLFNNGISIFNYFGHSSSNALNYNLNEPSAYDNQNKYPFFVASGCDAAGFFEFDTTRFTVLSSIAEKYVLAPERGSIALLGNTSFGVGVWIDYYNTGFYRTFANAGYNQNVGVSMAAGNSNLLSQRTFGDRDSTTKYLHAEQTLLHGDPAIKINAFARPDFAIEEPDVVINPTVVSVANSTFNVKTYFYNIGKATGDSVSVTIKRQYPDGTLETVIAKKIRAVRYTDSLSLDLPLIASRDKGQNKIIVSIDDDNKYDEASETNNTATKTFLIYEDVVTPVYPYNYSIVNKAAFKLAASTADPTLPSRQYVMEIDTTELFNSSFKVNKTIASLGGLVEFDPGVSFTDSTVYYWRVAPVPAAGEAYRWSNASFVYISNASFGYNQSHLYQHLHSATDRIYIDSASRAWNYINRQSALKVTNAIFPVSGTLDGDFEVRINENIITQSACLGHSVIYNIFDPVTLKPLINQAVPSYGDAGGSHGGFMGSAAACEASPTIHTGSKYNFEYSYLDTTSRRKMRDFMDWIPAGAIVTARIIFDQPYNANPLAPDYKNDQQVYGVGNSWYDRLVSAGFTHIDSFSFPRTWILIYQKSTPSFDATQVFSAGLSDKIVVDRTVLSPDSLGFITSPVWGPAKAWKSVKWRGKTADASAGDKASVDVIGVTASGAKQTLYTLSSSQQDFDISTVDVKQYPSIQLQMRNADSIHNTPYQLQYWRVLYDPVPEGALSATVAYAYKDSLAVGEVLNGAIGFKNVSDVAFADSIQVNAVVYNKSNVPTVIPVTPNPLKKLAPGDTTTIHFTINSKDYSGANTLYLDVNPNGAQPEQTHTNNFFYKGLTVSTDIYNPLLDVTFDGVHILNNDIVSSKPYITVKLTDESKYLLLNDTSLITVQLLYPDGSLHKYNFNSDTLRFTPATSGANNVATVEFLPYLPLDGDYKLLVSGKDRNGNSAGNTQYSVSFQVINKPMISDMFNYPNPFTTSTAFVFTVTGSQVPQNLRIQILTITGKIVKEITKEELTDVHIGRNITAYKWDGTDQYGQKLGNGVYLYRVLTNLDGKSLDHFTIKDVDGNNVNTSQYFNKGYGKMYLMR